MISKNKKGQGLTLNTIVIAILVIIVLLVLIYVFAININHSQKSINKANGCSLSNPVVKTEGFTKVVSINKGETCKNGYVLVPNIDNCCGKK